MGLAIRPTSSDNTLLFHVSLMSPCLHQCSYTLHNSRLESFNWFIPFSSTPIPARTHTIANPSNASPVPLMPSLDAYSSWSTKLEHNIVLHRSNSGCNTPPAPACSRWHYSLCNKLCPLGNRYNIYYLHLGPRRNRRMSSLDSTLAVTLGRGLCLGLLGLLWEGEEGRWWLWSWISLWVVR